MICAKIGLTLDFYKSPMERFSGNEHKVLKELQSDTSIALVTIGKGRSTVILNHENYLRNRMGL